MSVRLTNIYLTRFLERIGALEKGISHDFLVPLLDAA